MSTRTTRRRSSKRGRAGRGTRIWMRENDDLPLSLLALIAGQNSKTKKKATPQKKTMRGRPAVSPATPATASDIIVLDDTPEAAEIAQDVESKFVNFMQSGSFISSDEDETEMIKAKTHKKPSPSPFFISDDSDDDCKIMKQSADSLKIDFSKPSTSASTSMNPSKNTNIDNHVDNVDIMNLVESVLVTTKETEQNQLKDMKSLEDYRKETEEMLKNASSLLDEIKAGRKPEPEENKKEESPSKVAVTCPVCLESLVGRPASVTVCGHIFCKECIMQIAQNLKKCPTCRKPVTNKKIHPIYF